MYLGKSLFGRTVYAHTILSIRPSTTAVNDSIAYTIKTRFQILSQLMEVRWWLYVYLWHNVCLVCHILPHLRNY